ncbi:hypothetical protein JZU46_00240 [bacterium]|nr:hypothetical protein [bacterium]
MKDHIPMDVTPQNSNSTDKRRPVLMVSPRERQNKRKAELITSPIIEDLQKQVENLNLEILALTESYETVISDLTAKLLEAENIKKDMAVSKTKKLNKKDDLFSE